MERLTNKIKRNIHTEMNLEQNLLQHFIMKLKRSSIFPVTKEEQPPDRYPQSYIEVNWAPVKMLDLKRFKEGVVWHDMHSPFEKQMLSSWTTQNRIIPQD